jgi:DNA-directed RNA polymerase specialized sigma24 family protein
MAADTRAALVAAMPRALKLANFLDPRFAEDAVQDSLLECLRHAHRIDPATAHSYLFTCVRNRVIALRRMRKHNEAELVDIHIAPAGDHDAWLDLQAALPSFKRTERRAIVGRMVGAYGSEIGAASRACTVSARRRLKARLG